MGDQDAPELLKSKGSREKTRTRVKRFAVVCERSETIASVRNVPKPRIEATAALPEPLPEADGRQQDSKRKGLAEMVETCRDCPEIVRNVRPSKGVTRTMTPCRKH